MVKILPSRKHYRVKCASLRGLDVRFLSLNVSTIGGQLSHCGKKKQCKVSFVQSWKERIGGKMARKTVGYVELEWTCPHCETRNPGPNKYCNGCGAPQPEDVEFEQPLQEKLIEDEAKIALAKAGPDIHCPYCGTRNPAQAKFCGSCGGDIEGGKARDAGRVVGAHRREAAAPVQCPSCGSLNPPAARKCSNCGASLTREDRPTPQVEVETMPASPPRRRISTGLILILSLACLAIGAFAIIMMTRTEELVGEVRDVSWTHTIPIEAIGSVEHQDWLDEIPADAEVGTCRSEYHHTQDEPTLNSREICGTPYTVDTGTGVGEVVQDCVYEIYEDYCTYTAQEWQIVDEVTVTGSDLDPYWPRVDLGLEQREGQAIEEYETTFWSEEGTYTYTPRDETEFRQFVLGSRWVLTVNTFNTVISVEAAR
jgi:predicted nucleic acid-binding Zn ribbon protein